LKAQRSFTDFDFVDQRLNTIDRSLAVSVMGNRRGYRSALIRTEPSDFMEHCIGNEIRTASHRQPLEDPRYLQSIASS
jgi:hypothetical protein